MSGVKGADSVGNIFVLRSPSDGNRIAEEAGGKKVVIIGSSFIGMEVAAFLATKSGASSVTVVGNNKVPFANILGDKVRRFRNVNARWLRYAMKGFHPVSIILINRSIFFLFDTCGEKLWFHNVLGSTMIHFAGFDDHCSIVFP